MAAGYPRETYAGSSRRYEDDLDAMIAALARTGECGRALVEETTQDSPLGPLAGWPPEWLHAVQVCLESPQPTSLMLGPEFHQVYNDAYVAVLGDKSASALLAPARATWAEIWGLIEPLLQQVWQTGRPLTFVDEQFLLLRRGFLEETYFSYSFCPVRGQGGEVTAIFNPVSETTEQVLARRRLSSLHRLASDGALAVAAGADEAARRGLEILVANTFDVPFAMACVQGRQGNQLRVVARAGVAEADADEIARQAAAGLSRINEDEHAVALIELGPRGSDGPATAAATQASDVSPDEGQHEAEHEGEDEAEHEAGSGAPLACGPWPTPPATAAVVRLTTGTSAPRWLLLGLSPRLALGEAYREYALLAATQLTALIDAAVARELERSRATNLEIALQTSRQIGAAIGVLMAGYKVTEDEAFELLRGASQRKHRKLRDVADSVLLTGALPD